MMKLNEKGKYYELPIGGLKIQKIIFDGMLSIVLNDEEHSYLEIHSSFKVIQHNQTKQLSQKDKEAFLLFFDHYSEIIKEAKADKKGNLWLTFSNGTDIFIEDGPYENWHYTKINKSKSLDSLHVHGGIGRLVF